MTAPRFALDGRMLRDNRQCHGLDEEQVAVASGLSRERVRVLESTCSTDVTAAELVAYMVALGFPAEDALSQASYSVHVIADGEHAKDGGRP